MLILSPDERAQAWHDAVSAEATDREYKLRYGRGGGGRL